MTLWFELRSEVPRTLFDQIAAKVGVDAAQTVAKACVLADLAPDVPFEEAARVILGTFGSHRHDNFEHYLPHLPFLENYTKDEILKSAQEYYVSV